MKIIHLSPSRIQLARNNFLFTDFFQSNLRKTNHCINSIFPWKKKHVHLRWFKQLRMFYQFWYFLTLCLHQLSIILSQKCFLLLWLKCWMTLDEKYYSYVAHWFLHQLTRKQQMEMSSWIIGRADTASEYHTNTPTFMKLSAWNAI